MSVLHDLSFGSVGMDPVINMMKSRGSFASSWAKTLSLVRDKPLIRCEKCTKSTEEIGGAIMIKVCSNCKKKLNFAVHYCSQ